MWGKIVLLHYITNTQFKKIDGVKQECIKV